MRLRNDYRSISYPRGSLIRIIPNLREQQDINIRHNGQALSASIGGDSMLNLQGSLARITRVIGGDRYEIDRDNRNVYSADMFTGSYTVHEDDNQDQPDAPGFTDLIRNGMYLFSRNNDGANNRNQELFRVSMSIRDIQNGHITGVYIKLADADKQARASDIDLPIDTWVNNEVTWLRYGRTFRVTFNPRTVLGRQMVSGDLYIPNNDVLMERFGVSNTIDEVVTKKVEGHLDLPNLFEDSKYPVVYLTYTNDSSYALQKDYGFKVSSKILVTINDKSKVSKKIINTLQESKVFNNEKHIKHLILDWSKPTIKSYEKSAELFGHKTRKKAMFEATDDKGKKKVFKLTSIKFNYDKKGTFHHVVELNDGTLNLKFLLEDIDLNLPNVNDYVAPKDRTIKEKDECKLVNNKITPVQKNSTVKVIKMFNRHQVHNPRLGVYDKNTVAIVVDKSTNKQFECKIKQLKKI